jgi:hypothetical protein
MWETGHFHLSPPPAREAHLRTFSSGRNFSARKPSADDSASSWRPLAPPLCSTPGGSANRNGCSETSRFAGLALHLDGTARGPGSGPLRSPRTSVERIPRALPSSGGSAGRAVRHLLGDGLRHAATAQADEDTRATIENALRQRQTQLEVQNKQRPQGPEQALVGASSSTTPYEVVVGVRSIWWAKLVGAQT